MNKYKICGHDEDVYFLDNLNNKQYPNYKTLGEKYDEGFFYGNNNYHQDLKTMKKLFNEDIDKRNLFFFKEGYNLGRQSSHKKEFRTSVNLAKDLVIKHNLNLDFSKLYWKITTSIDFPANATVILQDNKNKNSVRVKIISSTPTWMRFSNHTLDVLLTSQRFN